MHFPEYLYPLPLPIDTTQQKYTKVKPHTEADVFEQVGTTGHVCISEDREISSQFNYPNTQTFPVNYRYTARTYTVPTSDPLDIGYPFVDACLGSKHEVKAALYQCVRNMKFLRGNTKEQRKEVLLYLPLVKELILQTLEDVDDAQDWTKEDWLQAISHLRGASYLTRFVKNSLRVLFEDNSDLKRLNSSLTGGCLSVVDSSSFEHGDWLSPALSNLQEANGEGERTRGDTNDAIVILHASGPGLKTLRLTTLKPCENTAEDINERLSDSTNDRSGLKSHLTRTVLHQCFPFDEKIRQVSGHCYPEGLYSLVRQSGQTNILRLLSSSEDSTGINGNSKNDTGCTVASFIHGADLGSTVSHASMNEFYLGEAALINRECVKLWDYSRGKEPAVVFTGLGADSISQDNGYRQVLYGSQPKHLLAGDSHSLLLLDIRSFNRRPLTLYSLPTCQAGGRLATFSRLQSNFHQSVLITDRTGLLIDDRFPRYPALTWSVPSISSINYSTTLQLADERSMTEIIAMSTQDPAETYCLPLSADHCRAPTVNEPLWRACPYSDFVQNTTSDPVRRMIARERVDASLVGVGVCRAPSYPAGRSGPSDDDGFCLLQLSGHGDLFSQTFVKIEGRGRDKTWSKGPQGDLRRPGLEEEVNGKAASTVSRIWIDKLYKLAPHVHPISEEFPVQAGTLHQSAGPQPHLMCALCSEPPCTSTQREPDSLEMHFQEHDQRPDSADIQQLQSSRSNTDLPSLFNSDIDSCDDGGGDGGSGGGIGTELARSCSKARAVVANKRSLSQLCSRCGCTLAEGRSITRAVTTGRIVASEHEPAIVLPYSADGVMMTDDAESNSTTGDKEADDMGSAAKSQKAAQSLTGTEGMVLTKLWKKEAPIEALLDRDKLWRIMNGEPSMTPAERDKMIQKKQGEFNESLPGSPEEEEMEDM